MKNLVLTSLVALMSVPAAAKAQNLTDTQKGEVEGLIREYLLKNGDVVLESVNNFQQKQQQETEAQAQGKAAELLAKLKNDKNIASVGNPKGDVLVVEFLDYNCGYCKKAFSEVQTLLKEDKNVRVVFYDMPILGPSSVVASRWALASKKQDKYWEFHQALMQHQGSLDETALTDIAEKSGLDVKKLKKDLEDKKIDEEIAQHMAEAQALGIQGTPGFLVNEQIFRGYIPYDAMKAAVAQARKTAGAKAE